MSFNDYFWNSNGSLINTDTTDEFELLNKLKVSDYSPSFSGTGENMSITLHQSYLNNSFNTLLNASDVNNNSFYLPCPIDTTFNSSYTKIDINDIFAPNKNMTIEGDPKDFRYQFDSLYPKVTSFIMPSSGYLENISVYIYKTAISTGNLTVFLYNSTSDGKPDGDHQGINIGKLEFPADDEGWHTLTGINYILNNSKTENKMWFFGFIQDAATDARWFYVEDPPSGDGDGVDETKSMEYTASLSWDELLELDTSTYTIDFMARVGLKPLNNTPNPEYIGMKINNELVNGFSNINGSGYWESIEVNSSISGELKYVVSADWWNVICNVSQVQINYTKTNLEASSEFNIAGSGLNVDWTVTAGSLDDFKSEFDLYWINFTVPAKWSSFEAFNDTIELTDNTTLGPPQGSYREYQIYNASNGPNWYITADSTNLLSSINSLDTFNFTDSAHFDATFSPEIGDGIINLSVYSPASINNELNYSIRIESFTAGSVISLTDWDIFDNVTQYGDFRVHVYWNNNTAAGFREEIITILGETELIPTLPAYTFDAGDTFDFEVYFNDTGLVAGIGGADITYRLGNGAIRSDDFDHNNGTYTINVDCNDTDFSAYGPNLIEINASKSYYNNQSEVVQIIILGETDLDDPIVPSLFDSTESFNVSLYFNDTVKDSGIFGAIRDVYVNSTPHTPISNYDYGDGNYNFTINCDDDSFANLEYGYFNISINFEKSYYYNQSIWFIIHITGVTDLTTTKFPDPIIGYYNSDEIFNITAYFRDIGRNEGINGGLAKIYVKEVSASSYQEYTPVIIDPFGGGNYNITVNCSDPIFNPYGKYNIKINITKSFYYMAEDTLTEIVVGNTTLTILEPTGTISYVEDETFDIVIEYEDHTISSGITGADITYTIDGTIYRSDNLLPNGDGTYNITIDAGDADFGTNYGYVNIIIRANKTNYINLTRTFTFERQITTQIKPFNNPPSIEVIKGINATYTFNYTDTNENPIDRYDTFQSTSPLNGFQWYLWNDGAGYYTINLTTSNVLVIGTPYILNFSIYAFGNQSQEISLSILVTIIETRIEVESWNENADFARSTGLNISIDFYFNDTTNNKAITGLLDSDISIENYNTSTTWDPGFELFDRVGDGNYKLNISTLDTISGLYTLEVNISKYPNFNYSLAYIQFYLRGNYTQIKLISISDPGGQLTPEGAYYNFTIFEGSDISIEFNMTDLEYGNNLVSTLADSYTVRYQNLNTAANGTIATRAWEIITFNHRMEILTSDLALVTGNYEINITINKLNYEEVTFVLNLTVIQKYQAILTAIPPESVDAGLPFTIVIEAEYYNGSVWLPIDQSWITIIPYYNGEAGTSLGPYLTNSTGEVEFEVPTYSDTRTLNLTIQLASAYYHQEYSTEISDITIIPSTGPTFEDFIPILIIIGAVIAGAGGSIGVYRGVIVPKKREKSRVLKEVKTIFDDAINLEHILVLYKGSGTCIFFKSFGTEGIDPELISGFISAICSFGKDLVCQEELNEITYGDRMLLLSDGEFIRVALVLSKKASIILRKNLMDFINGFEKSYASELPNWRGQLNVFRNAGALVDEVLSTSIILPHEITYKFSNVKALKNPHSKDVLKVVNTLMKNSDRNFFFIATLLKEATEKTHKDTAEIFMGIKELRDKKILIPIEIGAIEAQPISQQELALINQKVAGFVNVSQEEKQKLVNDLAQMGPAEREAYFASLMEQHEIISAPIEEKPGAALIDNLKSAKKEISKLKKIAKTARKEKDYGKTINIFQNAAKIATSWELTGELEQLNEFIRSTKIEDLRIKMKILEKEAKLAAKEEKYNEASQKYKMSSKIASEIFKLGGTEMTKEVKRLSNKSKEYEKLI